MTDDVLRGHVERLLGVRAVDVHPVNGGGWSIARRAVVELAGGRRVFAKMGDVADTIRAIRAECEVFALLPDVPFVPRLVAADPEVPVLVIEDLSGATWPPPWTPGLLAGLDRLFAALAGTPAPAGLHSLRAHLRRTPAWELVVEDPAPFLSCGVASPAWLERCLPVLRDAQAAAPVEGDRLLHLDVRSDNVCFAGERAVLVDWNHAAAGDPRWDRVLMVHTIEMEGGPPARTLAPSAEPGIVAWLAGFFAARAGLPPPEGAPRVRGFQLAQLRLVLPWATELLGLPPPDAWDG